MIDDMGAVGLYHVLNDTDGFGIVVVLDGLCCLLLIAKESRRKGFGVLTGDMVEVVGFHVAGCHSQTVVNRAEGIFIAGQVGLVEGIRDLSLEEDGIDLHRRVLREFLADGHGILAAIHMMVG